MIVGALARARPGLLHEVEARRVRNGWGLVELSAPGVIPIAVGNCRLLGASGRMAVEGVGWLPVRWFQVRVVDCQQAAHRAAASLESLGIAADYDGPAELAHRQTVIMLETE